MATVIILVIATNRIDRRNFEQIHSSFESVFKDRLIAEQYLFELSRGIHSERQLISSRNGSIVSLIRIQDTILNVLDKYKLTSLTPKEEYHFDKLENTIKLHLNLERNGFSSLDSITPTQNDSINSEYLYSEIWSSLDSLSEIQLNEATRLLSHSETVMNRSSLTSQLELGVLILIGLILQAIVLASRPFNTKFEQKSHLN
ncbi:hypothetical protein GYB22_11650 [bacterium]|nr:hypothetical protein [bacterium]